MSDSTNSYKGGHYNNINLIYENAEKSLDKLNSSQNTVNTKLGFILSFDAAYVRLALDLPDNSCFISISNVSFYLDSIFKIFTYIFLSFSLGLCIWGFKPTARGEIVLPEELMEECSDISEEIYRVSMIDIWNKSIKELDFVRNNKTALLDKALVYLGLAAIFSILDVLLSLIF